MKDITDRFGGKDTDRFFIFDSIKEMRAECVDAEVRIFAYVKNVIFRDYFQALTERWGYMPSVKVRRTECIIEDIDGEEFMVGIDKTVSPFNIFRPRISDILKDHDLINVIYGMPTFQTTGFDPVRMFDILDYRSFRCSYKIKETKREPVTFLPVPAYA